jgi:COP9 signalosome complex subunit 4
MCHCSNGLCCLLIFQDDDAVNAEAFINKASFLVSSSQQEVLNLQYKV